MVLNADSGTSSTEVFVDKRIFKEKLVPINPETRIRLRLFREKGRGLVNFVIQLEFLHEWRWKVVVRYDCFHRGLHKDIYSPSGRKRKIEEISRFRTMKEASEKAVKDIRENHEEYVRKFAGDKQ